MHTREFEYREFDYPIPEIHYSDLAVWRQCPAKFNHMMSTRVTESKSLLALLGSVFHNAFEVCSYYKDHLETFTKEASTVDWWEKQIHYQLTSRPGEVYDITPGRIEELAIGMAGRDAFNGVTLGDITVNMYKWASALGLKIINNEIRLKYGQFVGTLDILAQNSKGEYAIIDIKTSGMWSKLLSNKSVTKQSYSQSQLAHHPQLKHYHWMVWKTMDYHLEEITNYGIGLPANLIPYTTGKNKGKHRGLPYQIAQANPKAVKRYEEDMFEWLRQIEEGNFIRTYPAIYGKLMCDTCPFVSECLSDQDTTFVPEYLR